MRSTECGCVCSVPCVTEDVYLYGLCELCVRVCGRFLAALATSPSKFM